MTSGTAAGASTGGRLAGRQPSSSRRSSLLAGSPAWTRSRAGVDIRAGRPDDRARAAGPALRAGPAPGRHRRHGSDRAAVAVGDPGPPRGLLRRRDLERAGGGLRDRGVRLPGPAGHCRVRRLSLPQPLVRRRHRLAYWPAGEPEGTYGGDPRGGVRSSAWPSTTRSPARVASTGRDRARARRRPPCSGPGTRCGSRSGRSLRLTDDGGLGRQADRCHVVGPRAGTRRGVERSASQTIGLDPTLARRGAATWSRSSATTAALRIGPDGTETVRLASESRPDRRVRSGLARRHSGGSPAATPMRTGRPATGASRSLVGSRVAATRQGAVVPERPASSAGCQRPVRLGAGRVARRDPRRRA